MITFKQYLTEARMAPLYHGTALHNAINILQNNMIEARTEHRINGKLIKGVSFTRNINTANAFTGGFGDTIFQIDQDKLSRRYKIMPVQWWLSQDSITRKMVGARSRLSIVMVDPSTQRAERKVTHNWTESEEFMVGPLSKVKQYITKIYYNPLDSESKWIVKLAKQLGIPTEEIKNAT